jgi:YggT family protein
MNSLLILFNDVVRLYIWILIINAVASWLVAFNIINTSNRFVYSVLDITYKLTDPPLRFIRRYIPNLGTVDISPVILILGLVFLRNFINEIFYKAAF